MSHQGFTAELDTLKAVATGEGPLAVIVDYAEQAVAAMRQASGMSDDAMAGEMFAGARAEWSEAASYLTRLMERNMENLELAREAILEIERRYRVMDGQ